ncbi:Na+-transporting NADH:ubiquinone oxidoreductase subunit A [Nonlabens sp. Hel1_33_55]|uniref:Na(+)-translocating NADH-quinone reductase subunit A n=1 Tax=Nonlabens sp. Hel1_33_55 TaxID=1336802 RepID=UPI000875E24B|nr:Na(+)-translocating NADH-quinone reductase subunit A [Nonlabens sp. Hel1_33_55]SCY25996.1 Na+-transporting NADH:ubiquinone oxidoreductase subunit A [Nonlabens sp. Hel1_33_55]
MSKDIRVRKGLDLKLKGVADKTIVDAPRSSVYAIKPLDFHAVVPKLVLKEGAKVKAGETIFYSKYDEPVKFVAPVSGTISEVLRGAKRRILEVRITADAVSEHVDFGKMDPNTADAAAVKTRLLESGCWPFIIQRPYDIVASSEDAPKSIFVSAYTTAPLAGDVDFIVSGKKEAFQAGIDALSKLTEGQVHVGVGKDSQLGSISNAVVHKVKGPHPAGNAGVQIHKVDPINFGEKVWVVGAEDVATIGNLFLTGQFHGERTVALVGSEVADADRKYYRTIIGSNVSKLVSNVNTNETRIISGDVLTGDKLDNDQFLNFYHNTLTLIPEGNEYALLGWLPFTRNNIPSISGTSLSWMKGGRSKVDTNLNGEERALVVTGEMEEVLPMDIYPMQLIKACMAGDIEKMENLGIYEVAPEDFALVDYINTSKLEAQEIIRLGLDLMITEVG